jgi:hypothetical protein
MSNRRSPLFLVAAFLCASLLVTAGCSSMSVKQFDGAAPRFEPEKFFTGRVRSWGVMENRRGNPKSRFSTDVVGELAGKDLVLTQHFAFEDGRTQQRVWRIRRIDEHRYEATANDVIGVARGEAWGNAFRWQYTLAVNPGNPLTNVRMSHWMYLQSDGTMVNRVIISKWGVALGSITEYFVRGAAPMPAIASAP